MSLILKETLYFWVMILIILLAFCAFTKNYYNSILNFKIFFRISGSNCALVSDYLPILRERLYRPLIEYESAGVKWVLRISLLFIANMYICC